MHLPRILGYGHESILEHAVFTFAIEGCSRVCTHQLVRHRIASYTQQSQRYQFVSTANLKEYKLPNPLGRKRHQGCKLTVNQEKEIVRWYLEEGLSEWQIARIADLHPEEVLSILREYGASPEKAHRTYNSRVVKEEFFESIDSPEKAYILGLIAARGSVDSGGFLIIRADGLEELLEEISERLGRERLKSERYGVYTRIWVGEKVISDLRKLLGNGNSSRVTESVSKELWPHFLRGYLDGAGRVLVDLEKGEVEVVLEGSKKGILEDIRFMLSSLGFSDIEVEDGKVWRVRIRREARELLGIIYRDFDPFLVNRSNVISASAVLPEIVRVIKEGVMSRLQDYEFVVPESILDDPSLAYKWYDVMKAARELYIESVKAGVPKEDSRFILPQAVKSKIVVTMNLRELKHFFGLRLCERAQWEIREVAWKMLEEIAKRDELRPIIKWAKLGPRCIQLGYCPERELMPPGCFMRTKRKWESLLQGVDKNST
ncbi:FAD-dependent thymidylate synthase, inactivated by insertion [Pyrococcus sp. ST04]|nr:FAD-dependent thymidylate synthase, inactivated by insertion [Pyrococcus sp. ST04]